MNLLIKWLFLCVLQGIRVSSVQLDLARNITYGAKFISCGYYSISYRTWCNSTAVAYVAMSSECLGQANCPASALYPSMVCNGSLNCNKAWTGEPGNLDALCLVVSYPSWPCCNTMVCNIELTGTTAPALSSSSTSSTTWDTWKIVIVAVVAGLAVLLLISLVVVALCCGCPGLLERCCCGMRSAPKTAPDPNHMAMQAGPLPTQGLQVAYPTGTDNGWSAPTAPVYPGVQMQPQLQTHAPAAYQQQ